MMRFVSKFSIIISLVGCDNAGPEAVKAPPLERSRALDDTLAFLAEQRTMPLHGTFTADRLCTPTAPVPQELTPEGSLRWAESIALLSGDVDWTAAGVAVEETAPIISRLEDGPLLAGGGAAFVQPSSGFLSLAVLQPFPDGLPSLDCAGTTLRAGFFAYYFIDEARYDGVYSQEELRQKLQTGYDLHTYPPYETDWTILTRVDDASDGT